ncbi:MAG: Rieske 2Fe-2S domain-containing protein [Sphingobium sp.]|nr:Rieske 2Fe-2S domain-containing protein [Sphingobium sp.]
MATLRMIEASSLPPSQSISLLAGDWPVLVCRTEKGLRAVIDRCSHADTPLAGGRIRRGRIACPLHGAMFDLDTGTCIGAAYRPLQTFPVAEVDDWIEVTIPDDPPPAYLRAVSTAR